MKIIDIIQKMMLGTVQFGMKYGIANVGSKPSKKEVFLTYQSKFLSIY